MRFLVLTLLFYNLVFSMNITQYSEDIRLWHEGKQDIDNFNKDINNTIIDKLIQEFNDKKEESNKNQKIVHKKTKKLLKDFIAIDRLIIEQNQAITYTSKIGSFVLKNIDILDNLLNMNISKNKIFSSFVTFDNNVTKKVAIKLSHSNIKARAGIDRRENYTKLFCKIFFNQEYDMDTCLKLTKDDKVKLHIYNLINSIDPVVQAKIIFLKDPYDGYDFDNQKQNMIIIYLTNSKGEKLENYNTSKKIEIKIKNIPINKFAVNSFMDYNSSKNYTLKDNISDGLIKTKINNFILRAKTSKTNNNIDSAIEKQFYIIKNILKEANMQNKEYIDKHNDIRNNANIVKASFQNLINSCEDFKTSKENEKKALEKFNIKIKKQYPYFYEEFNENSSANGTINRVTSNMNNFFSNNFLINNSLQKNLYSESNLKITEHNLSIRKSKIRSTKKVNNLYRVDNETSKYGVGTIYTVNHLYEINNLDKFYIPTMKQCLNNRYFKLSEKYILSSISLESIEKLEETIDKIESKRKHIDILGFSIQIKPLMEKYGFSNFKKLCKKNYKSTNRLNKKNREKLKEEIYAKMFLQPRLLQLKYAKCNEAKKQDKLKYDENIIYSQLIKKDDICSEQFKETHKSIFEVDGTQLVFYGKRGNILKMKCNNKSYREYVRTMESFNY